MGPGFWKGRRVFLTGHTGFKGSWLCLWLHHLGAEVTGYALAPAGADHLYGVAGIDELVRSHIADVRDLASLRDAMQQARPDIVLHLAAQALVRKSYADPVETYASNVMGTVHVCEAVRQTPGVQALVCVTSDKCYDNRGWARAYRESDAMGGHDPYSSSKGCSELVAAAYRASFFQARGAGENTVQLASARAGNVIGGGDWSADRLVPDLLCAATEGRVLRIRCPDATRPWQHVLDALSGYLLLAQRLCEEGSKHAQAWNFGPAESDACTVREVVEALTRHVPTSVMWEPQPTGPHEAHALRLDSALARMHLGWRPAWNLEEALARVAAWHHAWRAGADMRLFSLRQIEQHMSTTEDH
jgi:CDP-glucose 4,6-dehydratase